MASEILGLFASPELYQQNQDLERQQQALQYAQLNPYDRVTYGANLAGQRFGGALGSALGGTDPQLRIISARQSVMQGVDPSNPESILRAAQQLADVGDQQGALTLADYARKAGSELALQQQRMRERDVAGTPKELVIAAEKAKLQDQIAQLEAAPASPERDRALSIAKNTLASLTVAAKTGQVPDAIEIANARAILKARIRALDKQPESEQRDSELQLARDTLDSLPVGKGQTFGENREAKSLELYNKPFSELTTVERKAVNDALAKPEKEPSANISEVGVAVGTNAPVYIDKNKDEQFIYVRDANGKQVRQPYFGGVDRTTAKVTATAMAKQEDEFRKKLGANQAGRYDDAVKLRDNSIAALNSLDRLTQLDQRGLISGAFATNRAGLVNFLDTIGLTSEADKTKLASSENYQKVAGDIVLATLGGRLGAGFSNEDRKFIQGLVPQLETSPQARKELLDFLVTKNRNIVDETTRLINYAEEKGTLNKFVPKIPLVSAPRSGGVSDLTDEQLRDAYNKAKKGGR